MADQDSRMTQLLREASHGHHSRRELIKRGLALGLSAPAISALLATGASAAPGTKQGARLTAKQETTLQLYHDKGQNGQERFEQMAPLAEEAIGIGLEPVPFGDVTSYQQAILSSLPTREAPDLFTWWSGYRMEDLYATGNLLDVTAIWETAVQEDNLPESLAAAFTFDGKQYGVPLLVSYWNVFYSKKIFDEQGLAPPATWDDLMAAADTIKSAGITPFWASIDGRWPSFIWFEELLIRTDPDFYVELTQGKASYTDPVAVQAMETWKSMFDKDYFSALDITIDNAAGLLANGEIAMILLGTWYNQGMVGADLQPGEDYGAFILPNVNPDLKENLVIVETGPLCIAANAANVEASTEFLTWWVRPDAQTAWSNLSKDVPANPKAASENPVLADIVSTIAEKDYRLLQRYWEASPPAIVESAVDELARFMLDPSEYMNVLQTIEDIAQREWSRRKEG